MKVSKLRQQCAEAMGLEAKKKLYEMKRKK